MNKYAVLGAAVFAALSQLGYAEESTIAAKLYQQQPSLSRAQNAIKDVDSLFMLPVKGGNASALQEVKNMRNQAQQAMQKGDYAGAIKLAENAKLRYFELARAATPDSVRKEQQSAEFKQKLDSVEPLVETLRKTGREYGRSTSDTENRAQNLIRDAKQFAANRKFNEGKDSLDKAAILLNNAMSNMTRGVTHTTQKDTSPKGVYEYAKFNNDTYRTMVEEVAQAQAKNDPLLQDDVRQGDMIRKEALAIAARGSYDQATQRMSESSAFYKKVARAVGVPVQDGFD